MRILSASLAFGSRSLSFSFFCCFFDSLRIIRAKRDESELDSSDPSSSSDELDGPLRQHQRDEELGDPRGCAGIFTVSFSLHESCYSSFRIPASISEALLAICLEEVGDKPDLLLPRRFAR